MLEPDADPPWGRVRRWRVVRERMPQTRIVTAIGSGDPSPANATAHPESPPRPNWNTPNTDDAVPAMWGKKLSASDMALAAVNRGSSG